MNTRAHERVAAIPAFDANAAVLARVHCERALRRGQRLLLHLAMSGEPIARPIIVAIQRTSAIISLSRRGSCDRTQHCEDESSTIEPIFSDHHFSPVD